MEELKKISYVGISVALVVLLASILTGYMFNESRATETQVSEQKIDKPETETNDSVYLDEFENLDTDEKIEDIDTDEDLEDADLDYVEEIEDIDTDQEIVDIDIDDEVADSVATHWTSCSCGSSCPCPKSRQCK